MFEVKTNQEDLIVVYLHRFDEVAGLYADSTPVALCHENDLASVLDDLRDANTCGNYLLESVTWGELPTIDKLEVSVLSLRASMLNCHTAWWIHLRRGAAPVCA